MRITHISIDGFRNLSKIEINPDKDVNVFMGENAQGKTNLLEALWLCSGGKSFRFAKEKDFIGFDKDKAEISVDFETEYRSQNVTIRFARVAKERKILLNGVGVRSFNDIIGQLLPVIFTPEDLELTKGSPDIRRSYIDLCVSQIKPMFSKVTAKYEKILDQRNAVLKNIFLGTAKPDELDIWDEQLARQGAYISMMRNTYTNILYSYSKKLYYDISSGREELEIKYLSTVYEDLNGRTDYKGEMADKYYKRLYESRNDDIRLGYTQKGIHRDDISVKINGFPIKEFGSQGQNRSAALCLKLGQARALREESKEMPIILLDDVLSELDRSRKEFVLSQIGDAQIFITCCEPVIKANGRIYEIRGGKLR